MKKQWVISVQIPKVERRPIKKTQVKYMDAVKGSEKRVNDNINNIKTSTPKRVIRKEGYHNAIDHIFPFSADTQVEFLFLNAKLISKNLVNNN